MKSQLCRIIVDVVGDYSEWICKEPMPPPPPPTYVCCEGEAACCLHTDVVIDNTDEESGTELNVVKEVTITYIGLPGNTDIVEIVEGDQIPPVCEEISIDESGLETLCCPDVGLTVESDDIDEGQTSLEYATDHLSAQLVAEMKEDQIQTEVPAFICWYCARPFIGRSSFYMHLLQETLSIPCEALIHASI